MKQIKLNALAGLALGVVSAVAFTQGESLVSKSYIEDTYMDQGRAEMELATSQVVTDVFAEKMQDIAAVLGTNSSVEVQFHNSTLAPVVIMKEKEVFLPQGSLVVPISGTISVEKTGTLLNLTTGKVQSTGLLQIGSQYLVAENSSAIVYSTTESSRLGIQGGYSMSDMTAPTPSTTFTDVGAGDWYYNAVNYVTTKNLFTGTSDDKFSPEATMDRAMMMTVLYRLANSPEAELNGATETFLDVDSSQWFEPFVRWGATQSLTAGTGSGNFEPFGQLTRQQAIVMLYSFTENYLKRPVTSGGTYGTHQDGGEVAAWAQNQVAWAVSNRLFEGIPNTDVALSPDSFASRADVATFLMNYTQYVIENH